MPLALAVVSCAHHAPSAAPQPGAQHETPPSPPWLEIWPVEGFIVGDFGQKRDAVTAQPILHEAIDFSLPEGKPVLAVADAHVAQIENDVVLGNVLVLDHGRGVRTRYGCLSEIDVKQGDAVARGQAIARVGTCRTREFCSLHYEVWVDGKVVNPRDWTKAP